MTKKDDIRMLEGCMKAFLLEHLRGKNKLSKHDSIINEFPINLSSRRVDIVTVGKDTHAFEIKSAADGLYRLQGQVETYLAFFDKVTVVAAAKHIKHVMETTPPNVAVWELHNQSIRVVRRGKKIPINNPSSFIRLMRAPDLARVIKLSGGQAKPGPRAELVQNAMALPIGKLRKAAIASVKERYAKTTSEFWNVVGQRRITPTHLIALSPTSKEREAMMTREKAQSIFWGGWMEKVRLLPDDVYLHHLMKARGSNPFGPIPSNVKKLVGRR